MLCIIGIVLEILNLLKINPFHHRVLTTRKLLRFLI